MLDFIYYPVSFILWCWHKVFGFVLGESNGFAWALSIVFLTFTVRMILLKPAISQVRSMRKMQEVAPQMKAIQKKYANDRNRQAQEMQKLQREHGVNPLGGCLPLVLQIPVFIGLNWVLRNFKQSSGSNYFFNRHDIETYLNSKIFGVHLDDEILGLSSLSGHPGWHTYVIPVALPLMILASIATHFTARLSVQRSAAMSATPVTGQAAFMQKISMWLFPLGVLVFGAGFPIGLLLYWLSNNGWTLGQQHFVFRRMEKEEQVKKAEALEKRAALGPRPGQKPAQAKNVRPKGTTSSKSSTTKPAATKSTVNSPAKEKKPASGARANGSAKPNASVPRNSKDGNRDEEIPGLISSRSKRKQGRKAR